MNLHEYQAKKILKRYGIPIPEFGVAASVEEAKRVVDELKLEQAVLKIQVHAGGRGKAGGVKFAKSKKEILEVAKTLIGMKMVNQQTGPSGVVAKKVLLSKPIDIAKEYYIGALVDRDRATPILIASPEGGMEIEEVAAKSPEKILKMPFAFNGHLRSYQLLRLTKFMGWSGDVAKQGAMLAQGLAKCFMDTDASLLEINPLVLTPQKEIVALDAKLSIDDNALFRQSELLSFYDPSQVSAQEAAAKEFDLAYIAMHGQIGCMVNGAGLAMATMDIIQLYGGSPANFLDVGGGASKEKVAEGFRIILSDPNVKAILVNIFGGIMNCATLAQGVIHAAKEQKIQIPIVVRMEGTNVEEGKRLFKESHLKITTAKDLKEAAELAVQAVKHGHSRK
ncbi:MAG: ADP-forming succinate--CoA ligase subunit beta [Verrucomicrobia bacterium]|nr:ADP-forming succinate--CoA ligase subunit beta [Verrucomicrobiota bacterium]MBU6446671.1 ADP-forming succinate--CoA ligase subunit beta [Verrucomicrobiota bacterium]MDE3048151.1 ADP-forming succinate--CoA ligase subunit beta [Verrucomicrobiota bacterium]